MPVALPGPRPQWLLLQTGARPAADNMAVDELLLEEVAVWGKPVLRFYSWASPAATFGYFQRHEAVAAASELRPLIRRPTGGGVVAHDGDWAYSVVIPPSNPWYELPARESYKRLHIWLHEAFGISGVSTTLAMLPRARPAIECFTAPEQHDLIWQGSKIAGAAQRRNRQGLLIQGSVQPPRPGPAKVDWQTAMCRAAAAQWGVDWSELELSFEQEKRVAEKVRIKYGSQDYNRKR